MKACKTKLSGVAEWDRGLLQEKKIGKAVKQRHYWGGGGIRELERSTRQKGGVRLKSSSTRGWRSS